MYRLTERGGEALRGMLEDFPEESALNDGEFNVRLAYVELIEPEARVEILRTRATRVQKLLQHLRGSLVEMPGDSAHRYAPRRVQFLIRQRESEIRFLEHLADEEERRTNPLSTRIERTGAAAAEAAVPSALAMVGLLAGPPLTMVDSSVVSVAVPDIGRSLQGRAGCGSVSSPAAWPWLPRPWRCC